MFDRYTESARRAVFFARYEASQSGSRQIEIEHLLLAIFRYDSEAAQRLLKSPAKVDAMRAEVAKHYPAKPGVATSVDLPLSKDSKRALAYAAEESERLRPRDITPVHLIAGILRVESSIAAGLLRDQGITIEQLRSVMRQTADAAAAGAVRSPELSSAAGPVRDFTEAARLGKLGRLVGRERELERIIHILSRRTKNNAVLVGEAGVGKTAIVEGLAQRMAGGQAPPMLAGRRLLAIDASSLTARQRSRSGGTLEEALGAQSGPGNAIVFVRGLFNLAIAASSWAVVEAMHALEPLLAHTGIQCIATGSPAGLGETCAKAGMLARHFEVVNVAPVSEEDAIRIISGLKAQFEQFHGVVFAEGTIEAAVRASGPFLPGRHLPDRAIDLVDEAAVAVKLRHESEPPEVAESRRRIREHIQAQEHAIFSHDFEQARRRSEDERKERKNLERLRQEHKLDNRPEGVVTAEDIYAAVAARAGVTVEAVRRVLQEEPQSELLRITAELAAQVPIEDRYWIPFLAAYLLRWPRERAVSLARAMMAVKAKPPEPKSDT